MSGRCTVSAAVPTCERGDVGTPPRPSLRRLADIHGEPPWTLSVPFPDSLPPEALDFVGFVELGGTVFARGDGHGE